MNFSLNPSDWINIQEHFLIKCKYCKFTHNKTSVSLTFMKHHIETVHPDKVDWKEDKK